MASKAVGLIGLGQMGKRMAGNLIRNKDLEVVVHDKVQNTFIDNATHAKSATELVQNLGREHQRAIVTMLPNPEVVRNSYHEILQCVVPNTLLIDCSTVDPETSSAIASSAALRQCSFVDAPVSGGVVGAEAASLTFMVGADSLDDFHRAEDILLNMGKRAVHCGGVGNGAAAKLCNNLALAVQMLGVAEAMHLGRELGLDPKILAQVMNTSSARSWSSDTYNPCPGVLEGVPASQGYEGGFSTSLLLKDLGLALSSAKSIGAATPGAEHAATLYKRSADSGFEKKDFGSIFRFLEKM